MDGCDVLIFGKDFRQRFASRRLPASVQLLQLRPSEDHAVTIDDQNSPRHESGPRSGRACYPAVEPVASFFFAAGLLFFTTGGFFMTGVFEPALTRSR